MSTKVSIPQQRRSGPLTTAASESPTPTHTEDAGEGSITLTKCEATVSGTTFAHKLRRVKKKTTLLHPTHVDIPAGSITAILGTAESGKSTLLKFMAGCVDKNLECVGVVNLPGRRSYLPEETYLHRFYTPRTYIKHYDRLLSSDGSSSTSSVFSNNMNDQDVERLLDSLRIDHDRRDTIVGDAFHRGLSLGERRRLELGLLVLSVPDTLFCENPVEGLDSATSLHIMEFLKGYCSNSSRRVIITLNRPSLFVWNLIDNVILLSRGHVVYEGSRGEMEAFFAHHKMPTPARFSQLEHYLAVVNNFRRPAVSVDWEVSFRKWQQEKIREKSDNGAVPIDIEDCFQTSIPTVLFPNMEPAYANTRTEGTKCVTSFTCCSHKYPELVRRYILQMLLNPGILQIRLAMYTSLALFLGALFFNLKKDYEDYQAINSHAALLFYSSSFYIFMVCATLPFLSIDLQIRNKEVLNGFYRPVTHHLSVALCTVPACLILALAISVIQVNMVGLQNGIQFFSILTLALWCADALAFLVSLCAPHFVIGIVVCAGICGFFMALEGFMLVPSKFPPWLRWTYPVPFHTYVFRSLMFNEFAGDPFGTTVLHSYEIEDTRVGHDMIVLFCYGLIMHFLSMAKILFSTRKGTGKQMKDA